MLENEVFYPKGYLSPGEKEACCVFMPEFIQIINL